MSSNRKKKQSLTPSRIQAQLIDDPDSENENDNENSAASTEDVAVTPPPDTPPSPAPSNDSELVMSPGASFSKVTVRSEQNLHAMFSTPNKLLQT